MSNDGGADHLQPGTRLPPFALPATDGRQVDLAALAGKTLLIVYPWTGRPGHPNPPDWERSQAHTARLPSSKAFATAPLHSRPWA